MSKRLGFEWSDPRPLFSPRSQVVALVAADGVGEDVPVGLVLSRTTPPPSWHFELKPAAAPPTAVLPAPVQPPTTDLAKVRDQAKGADRKKSDAGKR